MGSDITLIAPKIKGFSGTKSYVENVMNGLALNERDYDLKYIRKIEISLFGKPYFGIITQGILSRLETVHSPIVHALSPEVVTKNTNVVTIHDVIPFTRPDIYMKSYYNKIAYKFAFKRALGVENLLVSTEYGKQQLMKIGEFENKNIRVVHHSIKLEEFYYDSNSPFPENTRNIVMLSDFNPRKRIDLAINAIKDDEELSFYHIGPTQSWKSNFDRIKEQAGKSTRIHFLGPLPISEVRKYLSNADLFVYLSEDEGFGYPILEAMACGCNVLINRIPVFDELFANIASFCDLGNFSREDIIRSIGKKGRKELQDFSRRFSVSEMGSNISSFYDEIMAK